MKTLFIQALKATGLLVFPGIACLSCKPPGGMAYESSYSYNLSLSFQDAAGNDLALGLDSDEWGSLPSDLYVLDVIVSEPCSDWDNSIYNAPARPGFIPDVHRPTLHINSRNGVSYLCNDFGIPTSGCPPQEMLTYKLKCPHVFGDDETHDIVTYWEVQERDQLGNAYAKCTRLEFNGQVIYPTHTAEHELQDNEATVVLNR